MENPGWHDHFPEVKLKNLVAPISDHNPILLETCLLEVIPRNRRFKFENKWLQEPNIGNVVSRSWEGFKDFGIYFKDLKQHLGSSKIGVTTLPEHIYVTAMLLSKKLSG